MNILGINAPWHHMYPQDFIYDSRGENIADVLGHKNCRLMAMSPRLFEIILQAYTILAPITNQWDGRHTNEWQHILAEMRDIIAVLTDKSAEEIQDKYAIKRKPE